MSESGNICKFLGASEGNQDLFVFQFIYETLPQRLGNNRSYAAFCCHLVTEGTAVFHTEYGEWNLKKGDIFFAFPSLNFTLEACVDFKYLYIAFVGNRPSDLLESMGITRKEPIRYGYEELVEFWFNALMKCNSDNLAYMAKGLVFYTFALFMQSLPQKQKTAVCPDHVVTKIQDAIERGYANADLSLDYLCQLYHYNTKYISRCFREIVGVSFSEYLTSCRIRHACVLLNESIMSVREIATSVGYKDALYFSKVFKKKMLASPSEYREQMSVVQITE